MLYILLLQSMRERACGWKAGKILEIETVWTMMHDGPDLSSSRWFARSYNFSQIKMEQ